MPRARNRAADRHPAIQVSGLDPLAPGDVATLQEQVAIRLRRLILQGTLPAGARLPATRVLAREFGLSRNTIEAAYAQLEADGLLQRRVGAGSFVAAGVAAEVPLPLPVASEALADEGAGISERGRLAVGLLHATNRLTPGPAVRFHGGHDMFPRREWTRLLERHARLQPVLGTRAGEELLGFAPLRAAIAQHLATSRGVRCRPEQLLLVGGSQQALSLIARLLLNDGDQVLFENPGYRSAAAAFREAGARLLPLPVDADGADLSAVPAEALAAARMVYVTPSNQYPTGAVLSAGRRAALQRWAVASGGWIVEDDFDAAFRWGGRPLTAMQAADPRRVLHVGSFNKLLFPSLRVGWIVVPDRLVDPFTEALRISGTAQPLLTQAALTDFLDEGHLATLIQVLRGELPARAAALAEALAQQQPGLLLNRPQAGTHLLARSPHAIDDIAIAEALSDLTLDVRALSPSWLTPDGDTGFVLDFAHARSGSIQIGVRALAAQLR